MDKNKSACLKPTLNFICTLIEIHEETVRREEFALGASIDIENA